MKVSLFNMCLIYILSGCVSNPANTPRSENVFHLNGERVSISDEFLVDIRQYWKGKTNVIVTSVAMDKSDVQWILDYIALSEILNSKDCKNLAIVETRKFDPALEPQVQPKNITPGLFDYAWDVDACGLKHTYRVVNKKGTNNFEVYPTKL